MTMNLLELPDCVLEEIFKYLSYDDIAKKRLVSTKINTICQSLLNRAFRKFKSRIDSEVRRLKPLVPRKQSQRWEHPDYQKIRYLERIELNLRVLYNVYSWYIDIHLCCFIPGKVIDTSLNLLRSRTKFWLDHDTLDVLLDEICMAQEHFREEIEPTLQKLKAQKENASMLKATKPPVLITLSSVATTQSPIATTQSPIATTQSPIATTQSPIATTQSTVATTQSTVLFTQSPVATTQSPVATAMQKEQNSNKCQFQDNGNCRKAYVDLNKKYKAVNLRSQAITKQLTNTRKEMADLRRRLETLESQKRSATGERNHHHIGKTVVKEVLRSSKRLAEAKK